MVRNVQIVRFFGSRAKISRSRRTVSGRWQADLHR